MRTSTVHATAATAAATVSENSSSSFCRRLTVSSSSEASARSGVPSARKMQIAHPRADRVGARQIEQRNRAFSASRHVCSALKSACGRRAGRQESLLACAPHHLLQAPPPAHPSASGSLRKTRSACCAPALATCTLNPASRRFSAIRLRRQLHRAVAFRRQRQRPASARRAVHAPCSDRDPSETENEYPVSAAAEGSPSLRPAFEKSR